MDLSYLSTYYTYFLTGARNAILLSVFSMCISIMLGILLALLRLSKLKIPKMLAVSYVEFIRGTPLMIQLFIIFYGLPMIGISIPSLTFFDTDISRFISGMIAMALNSSAYVCEIFRSGIQSVDDGQVEASRSLGFNYSSTMRFIVLPQALRNILPALGNELVTVIKESSVISVIGVQELMYNTTIVRSTTYKSFSPLIITALIYFVITFTLSKLLGKFEKHMSRSNAR
ncbi:amino acid ABC transporter permease [Ethanoligenens harbinense]|uniref:Polar amino acid ABC transporter, inner membrane subunit n=1 Tax=Ethanoligenens harbinense (strain DSM 18485 / JCM 12961 / CGMCC 1.5033 / YUAN-3) TaxID=663278 RepID=E6U4F1_ETHHY|nr:amino acid ABC transporter permease [Ethanoligenens harbinense]ADU27758.1 polar amino acid ABC transporter, inner membrane subunit [Ethanoligenens harbinense YUAN-3]AVQ96782.1 amino acid ABC transporter permease [Ethanoligenens harbinense YUAN-3]AYF39444.1 amino acid ABC transporter permease [Ethanoligenens harbinense]AYF42268.1 amino acid ABC transporter permease [Ethanoligenens harbinense]QCN93024.1 amino acid ABC transporter permease [Ethanoligenens harbinense]